MEDLDDEALVLGETAGLHSVTAKGARLRRVEVGDDAAFAGIEDLTAMVWGRRDGHTADLRAEFRAKPDDFDILVAEATEAMTGAATAGGSDLPEVTVGQIVRGAWVRYTHGTDFASFWGGTTHPAARGRGIYRALVAERARLATGRGFPFVRVDCSPDSLPVLTRLGLRRVATTVPVTFTPASLRGDAGSTA